MIDAIDAMAKALPNDKGGRPSNWRVRGMIYELARYYAAHTGKKPGLSRHSGTGQPSGPFFRFVSTTLQIFVPDQAREDEALYSEIRRILKIKSWQFVVAR